MKKTQAIFSFVAILALAMFLGYLRKQKITKVNLQNSIAVVDENAYSSGQSMTQKNGQDMKIFQLPLERAGERVTKKPFGIYITPKTSPIQPERFQGYHTGTDFEIFSEESDINVPVHAVCSGKLVSKEYVTGYGGVIVESCDLGNQPITAIYGHLDLSSINAKEGDDLSAGDIVGILGKAYSAETDGERKHLHLGFHKGNAINFLGYVASQGQLSEWIDPCSYVCEK